jgi:hypothetical protein
MDDLNALFDSVDGLKQDLMEYGTVALGAIGANVLWNIAVAKFVPSTLNPTLRKYGLPALAVVGGISLGRIVARQRLPQAHRLGLGVTIGLVTAGLTQFVKMVMPTLPIAGLAANYEDPLYGSAGLFAAPVTTEDVSGAPLTTEEVSGFASVMQ